MFKKSQLPSNALVTACTTLSPPNIKGHPSKVCVGVQLILKRLGARDAGQRCRPAIDNDSRVTKPSEEEFARGAHRGGNEGKEGGEKLN